MYFLCFRLKRYTGGPIQKPPLPRRGLHTKRVVRKKGKNCTAANKACGRHPQSNHQTAEKSSEKSAHTRERAVAEPRKVAGAGITVAPGGGPVDAEAAQTAHGIVPGHKSALQPPLIRVPGVRKGLGVAKKMTKAETRHNVTE